MKILVKSLFFRRFSTHISSLDRSFQQAPEILNPVGVDDVVFHVGFRMVDGLMDRTGKSEETFSPTFWATWYF